MKLGIDQLKHTVKRPFLSAASRHEAREALDEKGAKRLFAALSQLRGTALKAAQMLSMEVDLLPETYRRELEKSCHQVPPLNRVLVRKVLSEEFASPPEALFKSFTNEAFAAASLGQVHAATLHDGTPVAVKIQYPGIAVSIDSDMALMRQMVRGLPNSRLILNSLEEIHARLREEVDYLQEAENTRWFQQHLQLDGIHLPPLFSAQSSQRVLTTGLMPGLHLDAWLKTAPDQATRDLAAQRLYDLFVDSTLKLRRLHADPNPGNYLFAPDGALTVLDFGCIKTISEPFAHILPAILNAYLDDAPDALFAAYQALGMLHGKDSQRIYHEILRPFGHWLVEPLREETFDFGGNADYSNRGKEHFQRLSQLRQLNTLANEFIFFDRTLYGLCRLFERMGARVKIRQHWTKV